MGRSPGLVVVVGASYFVGHGFESLNRSQVRLFALICWKFCSKETENKQKEANF